MIMIMEVGKKWENYADTKSLNDLSSNPFPIPIQL